jgi:hypothetical protein
VVTRNRPEDEGKCDDTDRDKNHDPDCSANEKFAHIGLANAKCAKWCSLGLHEENKDGVKFVLMRN